MDNAQNDYSSANKAIKIQIIKFYGWQSTLRTKNLEKFSLDINVTRYYSTSSIKIQYFLQF